MSHAKRSVTPSLQEVIDAIYDAAFDPHILPEVVRLAGAYCGGADSTWVFDPGKIGIPYVSTRAGVRVDAYLQKYLSADPAIAQVLNGAIGVPTRLKQTVPARPGLDSDLYREFMRQMDFHDRACVLLARDGARVSFFGISSRTKKHKFDATTLRLLDDVAPHLRRALRIVDRIHDDREGVEPLPEALTHQRGAMFLLDRNRRVVFLTEAAQALVQDGRLLTLRHGLLDSPVPGQGALLHFLSERAVLTGLGNSADAGGNMPLRDVDGQIQAVVEVAPLRIPYAGTSFGREPVRAMVFVKEVHAPEPLSNQALRTVFNLTPAESRLIRALVEGMRLQDVADEYGLGHSTVRSQLRSIFDKTGVRRQSDLVMLLMAMSSRAPTE